VVGFYLCQADPDNPCKCFYTCFGSIALNDREQRFSQPKLELYGLFRALCAYRIFLVGVRNLIVEVDTRYIQGILNNPDVAPSASINCWIVSILTFHFELRHVPGKIHGPDGLSRRPPQPGDLSDKEDDKDNFNDWVDNLYSFLHFINPPMPAAQSEQLLYTLAGQEAAILPKDFTESDTACDITYTALRTEAANLADKCLGQVHNWLISLACPDTTGDHKYSLIICYAVGFFTNNGILWKRDPQGAHKRILFQGQWTRAMEVPYNDIRHRGFYTTHMLITE